MPILVASGLISTLKMKESGKECDRKRQEKLTNFEHGWSEDFF